MRNRNLFVLGLDRIAELGQIAFTAHQELEKWREPAFTQRERIEVSLKLQAAIEEQKKWITALQEQEQFESEAE